MKAVHQAVLTYIFADIFEYLDETLKKRTLFLDGAMDTMVKRLKLGTLLYLLLNLYPLYFFIGQEFLTWAKDLKGNNDLLTLIIHRQYLEAGTYMIETNTFSSISIA